MILWVQEYLIRQDGNSNNEVGWNIVAFSKSFQKIGMCKRQMGGLTEQAYYYLLRHWLDVSQIHWYMASQC